MISMGWLSVVMVQEFLIYFLQMIVCCSVEQRRRNVKKSLIYYPFMKEGRGRKLIEIKLISSLALLLLSRIRLSSNSFWYACYLPI